MMITGRDAQANLLVIPYLTNTALAIMVLRQAAALPIDPAHCETKAFQTAECIVRAARAENAVQTKSAMRAASTTSATDPPARGESH